MDNWRKSLEQRHKDWVIFFRDHKCLFDIAKLMNIRRKIEVRWQPKKKRDVKVGAVLGTIFCSAVAIIFDSFSFSSLNETQINKYIAKDILIPIFLAGPLFYILLSKIYELSIARQELQRIATEDSLTGLLNRRAFFEIVSKIERSSNDQSASLALLVIDVDYFKRVNDTYGHQAGDQALKIIADAISNASALSGVVARLGGEEFAVLVTPAENSAITELAETIRRSVFHSHFEPCGQRVPVSVSIGVGIGKLGSSFSTIFSVVDRELYKAKLNGRNMVSCAMI